MRLIVNTYIILVIFAFFTLILPRVSGESDVPMNGLAKKDAVKLKAAEELYLLQLGEPPKCSNEEVLELFEGSNPRNIIFFRRDARSNQTGPLLDPWGTPYAFDFSDPSFPWAYSFGKDKVDNGGKLDDVNSWD